MRGIFFIGEIVWLGIWFTAARMQANDIWFYLMLNILCSLSRDRSSSPFVWKKQIVLFGSLARSRRRQ
jgi:hypothetical protein